VVEGHEGVDVLCEDGGCVGIKHLLDRLLNVVHGTISFIQITRRKRFDGVEHGRVRMREVLAWQPWSSTPK
jgi:hypothetical protein